MCLLAGRQLNRLRYCARPSQGSSSPIFFLCLVDFQEHRGSTGEFILSAIALADQPPDIITATAQWMAQLCSIAETYYRVWYALRSICAMEFMAEII